MTFIEYILDKLGFVRKSSKINPNCPKSAKTPKKRSKTFKELKYGDSVAIEFGSTGGYFGNIVGVETNSKGDTQNVFIELTALNHRVLHNEHSFRLRDGVIFATVNV